MLISEASKLYSIPAVTTTPLPRSSALLVLKGISPLPLHTDLGRMIQARQIRLNTPNQIIAALPPPPRDESHDHTSMSRPPGTVFEEIGIFSDILKRPYHVGQVGFRSPDLNTTSAADFVRRVEPTYLLCGARSASLFVRHLDTITHTTL